MTHAQTAYHAGLIAGELERKGHAGPDGFTPAALSNCSRLPSKLDVFFRHVLPRAAKSDPDVAAMVSAFDPAPGPCPTAEQSCFWLGYYHQKSPRK